MKGWRLHTTSDGLGHQGFVDQPDHGLDAAALRDILQKVAGRRRYAVAHLPDTGGRILVDLYWDNGWVAVARGRGVAFGPEHGTQQVATPPDSWSAADAWGTLMRARTERGWLDVEQLRTAEPLTGSEAVDEHAIAHVLRALASGATSVVLPPGGGSADTAIEQVLRILPEQVVRTVLWSTCHLPKERLPDILVTSPPPALVADSEPWQIVLAALDRQPPVVRAHDREIEWLVGEATAGRYPLAVYRASSVAEALDLARDLRPPTQSERLRQLGLVDPAYSYRSSKANDAELLALSEPPIEDLVVSRPALGIHLLALAEDDNLVNVVQRGLRKVDWTADPLGIRRGGSDHVNHALLQFSKRDERQLVHEDLVLRAAQEAFPRDEIAGSASWLRSVGVKDAVIGRLVPFDDARARALIRERRFAEAAIGLAEVGADVKRLSALAESIVIYVDPADSIRFLRALYDRRRWTYGELKEVVFALMTGHTPATWLDAAVPGLREIQGKVSDPERSGWILQYLVLEAGRRDFVGVLNGPVKKSDWAQKRDQPVQVPPPTNHQLAIDHPRVAGAAAEPLDSSSDIRPATEQLPTAAPTTMGALRVVLSVLGSRMRSVSRGLWDALLVVLILVLMGGLFWLIFIRGDDKPPGSPNPSSSTSTPTAIITPVSHGPETAHATIGADGSFTPATVRAVSGETLRLDVVSGLGGVGLVVDKQEWAGTSSTWYLKVSGKGRHRVRIAGTAGSGRGLTIVVTGVAAR